MSDATARLLEARERQREGDLEWVMSSASGRRFVHWLIYEAGVLEELVYGGTVSPDPLDVKDGVSAALHAARIDGSRWLGKRVRDAAFAIAPLAFLQMRREHDAAVEADIAARIPSASAGESQ